MSVIGERIKELRLEQGVSQSTLGNSIGVSQKAVDYWERGYIVKLADFFNVSSDYLLGRKEM